MVEYETDKLDDNDEEEEETESRAKSRWKELRKAASRKVRDMGFRSGNLSNNEDGDNGE